MFHIRSARHTVDSKIDENRCKQKYELIQVMCILYRYITLTVSNCSISLTVVYPFQWKKYNVVQSDYFASLKHQYNNLWGERNFFYTLSHLYLHGENKGRCYNLGFIMISGVRHIVLKIKIHVKLRSLNYTNN